MEGARRAVPKQADRPALRRCIAVTPEIFGERHWARAPLLSSATDIASASNILGSGDVPTGFTDLLTLDDVDELVSRRGLRTPFLRMAKNGNVIDAKRFTRGGGAGAEIGDQVDGDRVLSSFADGATLVLQGLHRVWPPVVDFGARLSADLGHPVQVNAYITPPQSTGFSAHYDVHDVFVLQVAGEKRWSIHAPVVQAPLRDQPWTDHRAAVSAAAESDPVIDTVLRPGDVLYLPRGWLHSAQALGDTTAHLTVGVHPVTRYAVVEALSALAAQDPALRASLPLGLNVTDPDELAPQIDATIDALTRWLREADRQVVAEAVTRSVRQQVWGAVRPTPVAPLAQANLASRLDVEIVVVLRPQLRHRLRDDGTDLVLELADRSITFPASTAAPLAELLSGKPVRVADLPGLDAAEQLVLVSRLLREAVVVPAVDRTAVPTVDPADL